MKKINAIIDGICGGSRNAVVFAAEDITDVRLLQSALNSLIPYYKSGDIDLSPSLTLKAIDDQWVSSEDGWLEIRINMNSNEAIQFFGGATPTIKGRCRLFCAGCNIKAEWMLESNADLPVQERMITGWLEDSVIAILQGEEC